MLGNAAIQEQMRGAATGAQTHTIVRGDTLWGISHRYYGSGRHWRVILQANPTRCHRGGNLIYVDDVLTIPALSAPPQSTAPALQGGAPVVETPDGGQQTAVQPSVVEQVLGPDDRMSAERDYAGIFAQVSVLGESDRRDVLLEMRRRFMWEAFVQSLGAADVATVQAWLPAQAGQGGGDTLEARIDQAHNAARGHAALAAVDAVAATDTNRPPRITARIRELLGLGVAMSRVAGDDLATEGYLGVHQAERAAQALIRMPPQEYMRTVMLLGLTGDAQLEQSFVLLEAVAARLSHYTDSDASNDALTDVDAFADDIRQMDAQTLSDQTTVTQTSTGGSGLVQRYTMSCNVTSAVVVRAEADPVEALRLNRSGQRSITQLEDSVAAETETSLESHGGNVAVARDTSSVTTAVNGAISALAATAPAAELTAVSDYLAGRPFSATDYAQGILKVRAQINQDGYPDDQAMRLVREANIGGSQPGLTPNELQTEWNGALGVDDVTGQTAAVDWDSTLWGLYTADNNGDGVADRLIPSPLPATWTAPITAMLNRAAPRLESGQDVTFNVYWHGGGGHTMSFTNVRGAGSTRAFLVHDTWTGSTAWVPQASILQASWPGISTSQGLLCGVIG